MCFRVLSEFMQSSMPAGIKHNRYYCHRLQSLYCNSSCYRFIKSCCHRRSFQLELGYIFWSDVTDLNIKRFSIGGSTTTIITNIGVCGGLAVHWRTSQLYWTDQSHDKISVSDLDGNNRGTLIHSGLDAPRDIALDPDNGYVLQ